MVEEWAPETKDKTKKGWRNSVHEAQGHTGPGMHQGKKVCGKEWIKWSFQTEDAPQQTKYWNIILYE